MPMDPPRIRGPEDLASYEPPDPRQNEVLPAARKLVERFKGRRAICVVGEEVFAVPQYLRAGLANVMMDYLLQPELARKLAGIAGTTTWSCTACCSARGWRSWPWATTTPARPGPTCRRTHFREFVLPGLTTVVQEIKSPRGHVIKHTDGNIWGIMDQLLSTGLDMLGPLEPAYMPWTRCAGARG